VGLQYGTIRQFRRQLAVLTKLNILLTYDPAFILLDIYPTPLKTYVHTKKTCMKMLIAALFKLPKDGRNQDQDVLL
jgi:hypothetical protein